MRTHSAPGFDAVYEGVVDVFFALPDESWVYPGHGHDTTIGAERRTNPFLQGITAL